MILGKKVAVWVRWKGLFKCGCMCIELGLYPQGENEGGGGGFRLSWLWLELFDSPASFININQHLSFCIHSLTLMSLKANVLIIQ